MPTEGELRAKLQAGLERSRNDGAANADHLGGAPASPVVKPAPVAASRPNGGGWIALGWVLLIVGLVVAILGLFISTDEGASILQTAVIVAGGGLAQFGFLLILVGTILRALFFLPGREIMESELEW